jgi:hypothetical protein
MHALLPGVYWIHTSTILGLPYHLDLESCHAGFFDTCEPTLLMARHRQDLDSDQLDFSPRPVSTNQRGYTQLGLEHEDLSFLLRDQTQEQQQKSSSGRIWGFFRKLWGRRPTVAVPDAWARYLDKVAPRTRGFEQLHNEVRDEEGGSWRKR